MDTPKFHSNFGCMIAIHKCKHFLKRNVGLKL